MTVFLRTNEKTMKIKAPTTLLLIVALASGCAHEHLRYRTVGQANTLNDIFERQVLDNLAKFVAEPASVPSFAFPDEGNTNVTDSFTITGTPFDAFRAAAGVNETRGGTETWGLEPITNPDKLYLMRCAYQRAIGCSAEDPCVDCCERRKTFEGRADRRITVVTVTEDGEVRAVIDPSTGKPYIDPETGNPATLSETTYGTDAETGQQVVDKTKVTPAIDPTTGLFKLHINVPTLDCEECAINCGWLCTGGRNDIPPNRKRVRAFGYANGTYVWVKEGGYDAFAKLVLNILDIAVSDPATTTAGAQKEVTYYIDADGGTVPRSQAVGEVKATINLGAPNTSVLSEDLTQENMEELIALANNAGETRTTVAVPSVSEGSMMKIFGAEAANFTDEKREQIMGSIKEDEKRRRIQILRNKLSPLPTPTTSRRRESGAQGGPSALDQQRQLQAIGAL